MNDPKVSVIVTTCNRRDIVQRAIRSVIEQDYSNFDLHIVDDASDDDTKQALRPLVAGDEKFFYWRHDERKGLAAARNTGIAHCDGEYIAFLDDDDAWKSGSLRKRVERLGRLSPEEKDKLGVIHGGWEFHMVDEDRIAYCKPMTPDNIAEYARENPLRTMSGTCLFPRSVLDEIGRFDESLKSSVEHDLWMQLAVHGYHAVALDEPLAILFQTTRKKCMVADTRPRILGVEQFMDKWTQTYKEWYGESGARRFLRKYRTHVLGELAAQKFVEGAMRESWRLVRHVLARNRLSPSNVIRLILYFARYIVRACVPPKVVAWVKQDRKRTAPETAKSNE